MTEVVVLSLFAVILAAFLLLGLPLLAALAVCCALFIGYALYTGHRPAAVAQMLLHGMQKVGGILILFLLIGMMTALWRISGTIPAIVRFTTPLVRPAALPLTAFLLCGLMSVLTGTSFGTAATMGVICMTIAGAAGLNPLLSAGAILSGIFVGDRCSPVSSSALLVATLTGTDIFDNIRQMVRTAAVPFAVTCLLYALLGLTAAPAAVDVAAVSELFAAHFRLGVLALLPAACIVIFSIFRINVRLTMGAGILSAAAVALFYQHASPPDLLRAMLFGYQSADSALGALLNGGGICSMVQVSIIVCLSASFSGIFESTGLLEPLRRMVSALETRIGRFPALTVSAIVTAMLSCNQSLGTLLTHQLYRTEPDQAQLAIDLENTIILIAPLVPWSIAGAVPIAMLGAPKNCLLAACYLYLVPLWQLICRR